MIGVLGALLLTTGGGDFAPESDLWNGLSYVNTTAREAKVGLSIETELDWTRVDRDDILVFLNPGDGIRPDDVVNFVLDGGHAIIALDIGADDAVARAFGVQLSARAVVHDLYYRDHPGFPMLARPGAGSRESAKDEDLHFLWFNVEEIILNHPGALEVTGRARRRGSAELILEFAEPGQALVAEVQRGRGYAMFVSDASLFINDMQRHAYGDKQLVANFMRYYCDGDDCRTRLIVPGAKVRGRYGPPGLDSLAGIREITAQAIEELNALVAPAGRWLSSRDVISLLALGLVALLVLGGVLLPWPRTPNRFPWQSRARYRSSSVDYWVAALSTARAKADFGAASKALRARLERACQARSLSLDGRDALIAALRGEADENAARAAARCLDVFEAGDAAAAASPRPGSRRITDRRFEQLFIDTQLVIQTLERSRSR